ncbi:MAG: SdrD B-like domain-containing protein [Pseudomonadota bacterium]
MSVSAPAPIEAESIQHIEVVVEGRMVEVRARTRDGALTLEADPIFEALESRAEIEESLLVYRRFQDGAELSIDFADGKVRANGLVLGALPGFETRDQADTWLSVNAISVLTGAVADENPAGHWTFTLDERLRPKFDLDLWVAGELIETAGNDPRTIGPVLLIPLEGIADALGHGLELGPEPGEITVTRVQDAAVITLDTSSGLVTVNGVPRGVTADVAYIDLERLLLPASAVETLTGTHIVLEPGSSRIDVTLDERLGGGALPGPRVVDEAAETPLTIETLKFDIGDRASNSAVLYGRWGGFNGRLRYETVGGVRSLEEQQPAWVSLDVQSLDGWVATLGDSTSQFRELAGVDESRIRGAAWRQQRPSGAILAIAAGVPINGAVQVTDQASRPTFGGLAAGARLISQDSETEYGVSASLSDDGRAQRLVASAQKDIRHEVTHGLEAVSVAADAGVFNDPEGVGVDVRGRADVVYRLNEQATTQVSVSYDGARFSKPTSIVSPPSDELVPTLPTEEVDESEAPAAGDPASFFNSDGSSRFIAQASVGWRATENWGPIANFAATTRVNYSRFGGASSSQAVAGSASANARVRPLGLDLSLDGSIASTQSDGQTTQSVSVSSRALRRFDWGTIQANYTFTDIGGVTTQNAVGNISVKPVRANLGKGARVSAGPAASVVWTPEAVSARAGVRATASSGSAFGDRFQVDGQFSALQSVNPEDRSTDLFGSLSARYAITRDIALEASYFDDFAGRRDVMIGLRGRIHFNEPRRHTRPKDGRGVLKGQVFFDENRDGVRQPNEPGVSRVTVSVRGTGLALGVDRNGYYTIHNMKTGLFNIDIDRRSLPLGLLPPEDFRARATVGDGQITTLDIPLIASGQIRGAVFVDANGNGETDRGEARVEGALLSLERTDQDGEILSSRAAAFGQFGFENLPPGDYVLRVAVAEAVHEFPVSLTEDNLFAELPAGLPGDDPPPENEPDAPFQQVSPVAMEAPLATP